MNKLNASQQLLEDLRNKYITIARENNLTIEELNETAQAQAWIDNAELETAFDWVCAAQTSMFFTKEERANTIKAAASF